MKFAQHLAMHCTRECALRDVTLPDPCEEPVGRVEGGKPGLKAGDCEHRDARVGRLVALHALQSTHTTNHEGFSATLYTFEVTWGLAGALTR